MSFRIFTAYRLDQNDYDVDEMFFMFSVSWTIFILVMRGMDQLDSDRRTAPVQYIQI